VSDPGRGTRAHGTLEMLLTLPWGVSLWHSQHFLSFLNMSVSELYAMSLVSFINAEWHRMQFS
jgi:hypothetical protein